MSARLIDVVFSELDDAALEHLADMLASRLRDRIQADNQTADGWLDSTAAADYLGTSRNALHKLTAARTIPFEQDGPGCKCWFRRSDLDAYRKGNAAKTQPRIRS